MVKTSYVIMWVGRLAFIISICTVNAFAEPICDDPIPQNGIPETIDVTSTVDGIANTFGPVLASLIQSGKEDAIAKGVLPLSEDMKNTLSVSFDAELLDNVRYRVGVDNALLETLAIRLGGASAMALDNVILFRSDEDLASMHLMAHELGHVMQYRQWGVEEFARRYVRNSQAVEEEAEEIAQLWKLGLSGFVTPVDIPLPRIEITVPEVDEMCNRNAR